MASRVNGSAWNGTMRAEASTTVLTVANGENLFTIEVLLLKHSGKAPIARHHSSMALCDFQRYFALKRLRSTLKRMHPTTVYRFWQVFQHQRWSEQRLICQGEQAEANSSCGMHRSAGLAAEIRQSAARRSCCRRSEDQPASRGATGWHGQAPAAKRRH